MKKYILTALLGASLFSSCVDLDVAPKNIITADDLLSSESGMDIYMASLYSSMPFEDFKYTAQFGLSYNGWLNSFGIEGTGEALDRDGICVAFTSESTTYWSQAFTLLRNANFLIENLPHYASAYTQSAYDHYLGEAYYVRATVFYAMARRFGGVPLVTKVIDYPATSDELEVPRASEEETWNQILADYDMATSLLNETSPKSGYSNRYVALAYKSQAMLYAGCVAKYNETVSGRLTGTGLKTGTRVIGFDEGSWRSAAQRYFSESYKAAMEVINSGRYSLYTKKWAAGDKEAQYENMCGMYSDADSPENIYVKEYSYPTACHAFDAYNAPFIFRSPLSAGMCPTADFVELFEGFERYPDGTLKVTTGNSNAEGEYLLFDNPMDFYANAEPRLRAYVIFPGDKFKGQEIEIRGGVYTGEAPIKPFFTDYSYNTATKFYQHLDIYNNKPKTLYLSSREGNSQEIVTLPDGSTMTAAGANGPFYNNGEATLTGLYVRKWLNSDPSFVAKEANSEQHFILMRYAEVLLNAAEAAIELSSLGGVSPDGSDMLDVATQAINGIRLRAGASLLTKALVSDDDSRNIVRRERRKELAFEQITKWDLRRWRVNHYENRDLFWGEVRPKEVYSNNANYRFRGIYPFYSSQEGKYFFDVHYQWVSDKQFSYTVVDYYFEIPSGEVSKSKYIDQQPNR